MKCFKIKNAPVVVFRRWGRKHYSLFSTFHKLVKISVLSITYFLAVPLVSHATVPDTTEVQMEYDLDEIEVSAKRSPALYSQVARIISVFGEKQIEAVPAQNIQDLLEYVAGVDVRQRGAEGVQADVSIRGGTFDQTLILLNGINITDPQTGHHNFNLPVNLEQVERIEILEGPAARIYGPNAFSGAINIVTKTSESQKGTVKLSGGSFRYFKMNASAGFRTGMVGHLIGVGRTSSDGYTQNTDFKLSNLFYSNRIKTDDGEFSLQAGISGKAFGANSFYTPKYPEQFEETQTLFSSLKWESFSKLHFTPVAYWRRHYDRFELFRNKAPDWYTTHNFHRTDVLGGGINSWVKSKWGKTAFGAEFRNESIVSNVLGEEMQYPKLVAGEDAFYTRSKSRNTTSVFLEHALYYQYWTITGGMMANNISGSNTGVNIYPGLEISYRFLPVVKVFGSCNTSLRMPTFTDLYYAGPTNTGNPELKPERSASVEGGAKISSEFVRGHVAVFYREGRNVIDWVKMDADDIWQPQNLSRINSLGTTVQLQIFPEEVFGKDAPEIIQLSYYHNNLKKETQDFISHYVLDNLKHKIIAAVDYKLAENLFFHLSATYQKRNGTFGLFVSESETLEIQYPPFWLLNTKLNYHWKNFTVFSSVNNLFDKRYYDIGNVIQPGRWLKAGVAYKFEI